jgi:hypothetical protein
VNQAELQRLSLERIQDAAALIAGGRWSFADYVSGYAVECALKSCILSRMVHTGWVFEPKVKIDDVLTHDFGKLIDIAALRDELNARLASSAAVTGGAFAANWGTVMRWSVTTRYSTKTEYEARELFVAITQASDGVLQWTQNYW